MSELILKKWPMYRDAPIIQNQIADIYDLLTSQSREGTGGPLRVACPEGGPGDDIPAERVRDGWEDVQQLIGCLFGHAGLALGECDCRSGPGQPARRLWVGFAHEEPFDLAQVGGAR